MQKIFKKLYDQGDITRARTRSYCTPARASGPRAVVDGKCPDCGRPVVEAEEEAYFFKLSKYADRLIKHIEDNPDFIQPESRKNEMINNFLKPGLQDLCIARTSFKWGIPVTFDPKHVIYVWIDALSNYITLPGYDVDGTTARCSRSTGRRRYLIGKDILRFHTIYWPIMLMALDVELPSRCLAIPGSLSATEKMSKSKGNVVYGRRPVEAFGVDAVRYSCCTRCLCSDGTFTYELMIERINSDLPTFSETL